MAGGDDVVTVFCCVVVVLVGVSFKTFTVTL